MKVNAGELKGIPILSPKGDAIRPTSDRVKVDIFNIARVYINEKTEFLDLFAGTGAIGIEAVSRGAARATLIDESKEAFALILKNIERTRKPKRFKALRRSAEDFIATHLGEYDMIFIDPPYEYKDISRLAKVISQRGLLKEGGILITERSSKTKETLPEQYELLREKKYSAATVKFYVYRGNAGQEQV